ncbi:MAG: shikimate dehydrogenase [Actinomycetota bacterium]|nr:shikimate dehydrogenase [Actinomycetota bacterium]
MNARWPTASTRLVVLLGWPVRHSLSPVMHNSAFREQGLDLVYVVLPTPPDALATVVEALGAVGAIGANVTVPHKEEVTGLCDRLTDEARLVGAVNTLVWGPEGLVGDNTDAVGLGRVLQEDFNLPPGAPTVVLGTGGAARACVVALGRVGVPVTVIGRRRDAADDLAGLAERCGAPQGRAIGLDEDTWVGEAVAESVLAINATPLGMAGEPLPDPFHQLRADQMALDLVYRPAETPFLEAARASGAEAHHGLGMLVAQAAASYRRWTGQDAPIGIMSAAAVAELTVPTGR